MRKTVIATLVMTGMVSLPAFADTHSKTAPALAEAQVPALAAPAAPMPRRADWTGAFAGLDMEYGSYGLRGQQSRNAGTVGGFAGYRADLGGTVLGVEGRIAPLSFGSTTLPAGDSLRASASLLVSAGVALGADGGTLAHVSAGPTMLRTSGGGQSSDTTTGATVRVGVDHMLDDALMLRGGVSHTRASSFGAGNDRLRATTANVGLGFRF